MRKKRGLTREELASLMNVTPTTIYRKETGERKISTDELPKFALALNCSLEELIKDANASKVPVLGYIGRNEEVTPSVDIWLLKNTEKRHMILENCERVSLPIGSSNHELLAWRVKKEWEGPFLREDSIVYSLPVRWDNFEECIGSEVIVGLKNGTSYVKTLERGFEKGKYNLLGHSTRMIKDVEIDWCAQIHTVVLRADE